MCTSRTLVVHLEQGGGWHDHRVAAERSGELQAVDLTLWAGQVLSRTFSSSLPGALPVNIVGNSWGAFSNP